MTKILEGSAARGKFFCQCSGGIFLEDATQLGGIGALAPKHRSFCRLDNNRTHSEPFCSVSTFHPTKFPEAKIACQSCESTALKRRGKETIIWRFICELRLESQKRGGAVPSGIRLRQTTNSAKGKSQKEALFASEQRMIKTVLLISDLLIGAQGVTQVKPLSSISPELLITLTLRKTGATSTSVWP